MIDKTALSYWFPKLVTSGIPVPRTETIEMPAPAQEVMYGAFDGKDTGDISVYNEFIREVASACESVGYPAFLRTDHTAAKHRWSDTCFIADGAEIRQHVFNIIEYSVIASLIGLPWDTWVVREFLPTEPVTVCPDFCNMPVCREFRFFVADGAIRCWHPYWPHDALRDGGAHLSHEAFAALCTPSDEAGLIALAKAVARAIDGAWSVDILETKRGLFVTDMAEAHKSFHWQGCQHDLAA